MNYPDIAELYEIGHGRPVLARDRKNTTRRHPLLEHIMLEIRRCRALMCCSALRTGPISR